MKKALIITIFVGFVLNAAAFLFAAKPTIHWQFLFMFLVVVLIGAIVVF